MISNEHHEWLKRRDWPAVGNVMYHLDRDDDLLMRKYKERGEHGRLPHHWMAAKAQTHTHDLADVGVLSIGLNPEALTTRDKEGETPLDIARRSGACAEIIGLLSHTPEEARSLGGKEMARLYAPVAYWRSEMAGWINSRSWAGCHKFINEHDDELVREVLKYRNSYLLFQVAMDSQKYSDSLVFLALRMIHRNPRSLTTIEQGFTALQAAEHPKFNACRDIVGVFSLTPAYISSAPFPTLLRRILPAIYVENFSGYNQVCDFLRRTVSPHDKAVMVKIPPITIFPTERDLTERCTHIALSILYDLNHNMFLGRSIVSQVLAYLLPSLK